MSKASSGSVKQIGLLGAGVVGGGLIKLLNTRGSEFGLALSRVAVRDKLRVRPGLPDSVSIGSVEEVIADPDIDIVVEVMGGVDDAYRVIKSALEAKKSVVTANKAVVAPHRRELTQMAKDLGVGFRYEAAVAAGLPIIETLQAGLIFAPIRRLFGILNGTTNYILSLGQREGVPYEAGVRRAQESGFAEADPHMDVSGKDAAQKLAILTGLAFGSDVHPDDIFTQGIEDISEVDHRVAELFGHRIKLLGSLVAGEKALQLRVAPTLVPSDCALGLTVDEYNAVEVECEEIGWQLFLGKGAGEMPTASAVFHDLIKLERPTPEGTPLLTRGSAPTEVGRFQDFVSPWLVRFQASSSPSSVDIAEALMKQRIAWSEIRNLGDDGIVVRTERAPFEAVQKLQGLFTGCSVLGIEPDA